MGFEWLPPSLVRLRGIEPYEVTQALTSDRRWPRRAAGPGDVPILTIWACTDGDRRLIIALRQADRFDWWIVGAREMNPTEAAEYDRWEAER